MIMINKVYLIIKEEEVEYSDFINKDLIHFSVYDTGRSLPSFCDGLKISTRRSYTVVLKEI